METIINEIHSLPLVLVIVFGILIIAVITISIFAAVLSSKLKVERQRNHILRSTLQRREFMSRR